MNCPRCDKVMAETLFEDSVRGQQCPKCEGHWMEGEALRQLETTVEVRFIEWRKLPPEEVQTREVPCPRCRPRRIMRKVRSERDQHVLLDFCEQCHGVWLDGGELRAIREMGLVAAVVDAVRYIART